MTDKYPYKVYNADGRLVLQTVELEDVRDALSQLEHGCTIKFNGKKLTKKDIKEICRGEAH